MHYYQYTFQCDLALTEILLAFLGEYPFDTFQETEEGLEAYLPMEKHNDNLENYLQNLKEQFDFQYDCVFWEAQNWNAVWESNFHPIIVGNFCGIRADFHDPIPNVQHELVIQPKMAFGTGHHATTFQVIQMMESIPFKDKKVLDYGCGTGILAILAAKLGATDIDAIDIDEWSKENTLENATLNEVVLQEVLQGDLQKVLHKNYNCILANITFNVISSSIQALYAMLSEGGYLTTSGFFPDDAGQLKAQAELLGFHVFQEFQREEWTCVGFQK